MKKDFEQLIDDMATSAKHNALSHVPKDETSKAYFKIIQALTSVPKTIAPVANFDRVKNQILDRITIPKEEKATAGFGLVLQSLPRFIRVGGGIIGSFLILASLTIGVSIAAIESTPGQAIYPVKQVVENVQLQLANGEVEKANLQIKFANNRLEELEKVLEKNKQGKVSGAEVQKVAEQTVKDIAKTTSTVAQHTTPNDQSQVNILTKIMDLSNKQTAILETATITSEGEVKIGLEKALEASKISKEEAIQNIENAGLKVEGSPVVIEANDDGQDPQKNKIEAKGKITSVTTTSVSIATAKFLLTKDTKFVNVTKDSLKVDQLVEIKGEVIDSKTYALEIKLLAEPEPKPQTETPQTPGSGQ